MVVRGIGAVGPTSACMTVGLLPPRCVDGPGAKVTRRRRLVLESYSEPSIGVVLPETSGDSPERGVLKPDSAASGWPIVARARSSASRQAVNRFSNSCRALSVAFSAAA
ncbi:hypothetical protein DEF28_25315 [Marinitenerispora sediminis]|uniref:Uncharacterized protein n=1 Tax=Marinitenerispora sediminis TaxID=1931232 RepID=A0A368SYF1_9ACTN|nr:hypothetical protein DEF28_25315 [Marinitenerispora sediminis]RCV48911.1 hypothetical protein DEF24_25810 [Marinitenerispora sediminis]